MAGSDILLDYQGPVDFKVSESLLKKLRKNAEFSSLVITTRKRVFSIVVECLENITKNSLSKSRGGIDSHSRIIVRKNQEKIDILAGNLIDETANEKLATYLELIKNLDNDALRKLYETRICNEPVKGENSAGLGLISIALKSGNNINYTFRPQNNGLIFFEINISLDRYIMRKLIIERTSISPEVVLDPEKNVFLISGESRPHDVREFYGPILSWLEEYGNHLLKQEDLTEPFIFCFDFAYFNSSSAKMILDLCKYLVSLSTRGINIKIKWYHEKEDGDMLEVGKEMSRIVKFPFEYIESEN